MEIPSSSRQSTMEQGIERTIAVRERTTVPSYPLMADICYYVGAIILVPLARPQPDGAERVVAIALAVAIRELREARVLGGRRRGKRGSTHGCAERQHGSDDTGGDRHSQLPAVVSRRNCTPRGASDQTGQDVFRDSAP